MKRSEINLLIRQALDFTKAQGFALPPLADWTANGRPYESSADESRSPE